MPYYQCPKCSGRDTYEGTELVSGSKGGSTFVGPENDLGFSPVMKTGGKKTIDQVTVVKCKKCDIILGDKDVRYTEAEQKEIAANNKELLPRWVKIIICIIGGILLPVVLFFLISLF